MGQEFTVPPSTLTMSIASTTGSENTEHGSTAMG